MVPLTARQREVLAFIVEEYSEGFSLPTEREIATRFEIRSTNAVHDHLTALIGKGALRVHQRQKRRAYGLVLTHPEVLAMLEARRAA